MKLVFTLIFCMVAFLSLTNVSAADAVDASSVVSAPVASTPVVSPEVNADVDFIKLLITDIKNFKSASLMLKISMIIMLIIGFTKVSIVRPLWDKLGKAKVWAAPLLSLIGAFASTVMTGEKLTASVIFTFLVSGAGAVALYELLDSIRAIPGIGAVYIAIIDFLKSILGGAPKSPQMNMKL